MKQKSLNSCIYLNSNKLTSRFQFQYMQFVGRKVHFDQKRNNSHKVMRSLCSALGTKKPE
uniref:Uncharacterized protein n=1 Tax=Rhizophora mucronata TaxID=61149 RepID=A0A2P2P5Y5_RHIMU